MSPTAQVFGDEAIIHGTHVAAHWHMKHAKAPVYQYLFTLDAFGVVSFMMGTSKTIKGTCLWCGSGGGFALVPCPKPNLTDLLGSAGAGHGDDWGYVFKNHLISDAGTMEKERFDRGVQRMSTLVANFVSQM